MADREVVDASCEVPEIPEILEKMLVYALDEGKKTMSQGGEIVPFTMLAVKDNLFFESHEGDTPDECFLSAQHTVEGARGAQAYTFCYDGYVEMDSGVRDAIIAEGGIPGEEEGYAVCYLYQATEGDDLSFDFEAEPAYVGRSPNFMRNLEKPSLDAEADAELQKSDLDKSDAADESAEQKAPDRADADEVTGQTADGEATKQKAPDQVEDGESK